MTTFYQDDVTGETFRTEQVLAQFGIVTHGEVTAAFDTHVETVQEDPEAVAEKLHEQVDEWLADYKQYLAEQGGPR